VRRIARQHGVDAVLATLPATSLVRTGFPTAVVIYDLRHELRPEQFSRARRLLRNVSYGRGYAIADTIISISRRSLDDLHRLHPRTRRTPAEVVHLGADHVLGWPGEPGTGPAVTFAHHTNKNPDLILEGWAEGRRRGLAMPSLLVLGTGPTRERLQARVDGLGLSGSVELAPFLPDEEFARVMRSASMVVFPSDFEGFGLPVVEGMLLGVPVVIGPEPATLEVAGGHAAVLADWTPAALAEAVDLAAGFSAEQLAAARAHAAEFTWERVVEETRRVLRETAAR
jgi:glycosyltransferase involved in cell wall biosynthesis